MGVASYFNFFLNYYYYYYPRSPSLKRQPVLVWWGWTFDIYVYIPSFYFDIIHFSLHFFICYPLFFYIFSTFHGILFNFHSIFFLDSQLFIARYYLLFIASTFLCFDLILFMRIQIMKTFLWIRCSFSFSYLCHIC